MAIQPLLFWQEYERIVHCCGKTAYYWHIRANLKSGSFAAATIAIKNDRTIAYYNHKVAKWQRQTKEALGVFQKTLKDLGDEIPDERYFLNKLTLNPDYRQCCYDTIKYGKEKNIILSIAEINARYGRRLRNRKKKKTK